MGTAGKKSGKLRKTAVCLTAVFLLAALSTGCGRKEKKGDETASRGEYQIYYLDASGLKLSPYSYEADAEDTEQLLGELAGKLLVPPADTEYQPVLTEKTQLLGMKKNDNILYLDFSKEYNSMEPVREILCRAAFVKTLTQAEGIEFVSISCEGQPKLDSAGNPVGALGKSDFVEGITDINSYEQAELTLYFSNEDGTALIPETRTVVHSANTSLERLVVEQLVAGPSDDAMNPVFPKETKILNISVAENICYVNFDSSFLAGVPNTSEKLAVYAIVDSLTELQTVNKVQITVNGSQDIMYRDAIPLDKPFERDERYILKQEG